MKVLNQKLINTNNDKETYLQKYLRVQSQKQSSDDKARLVKLESINLERGKALKIVMTVKFYVAIIFLRILYFNTIIYISVMHFYYCMQIMTLFSNFIFSLCNLCFFIISMFISVFFVHTVFLFNCMFSRLLLKKLERQV